jgi:hypothetical protein
MPFPAHLIVPWIQHVTKERRCYRCGLANIPEAAVHPDLTVYEKQGRFNLGVPEKYQACEAQS